MASLIPPEPKACPLCFCPMHIATDDGQTFYICPSCCNTWVRAEPTAGPFDAALHDAMRQAKQEMDESILPGGNFRLGESLHDEFTQMTRDILGQIERGEEPDRQRVVDYINRQLQSTPQASNVRAVPERCALTDDERATSDRLLSLVFKGVE